MPSPSTETKVSSILKRAGAFSLIEVTIAIGIASFCLLTTLGLLGNGFSTASDARNRTAMSTIAARTFAVVAQELATGNDPTASLPNYGEFFDAECRPLSASDGADHWAYRSSLTLSPSFAGSQNQNGFILRAEVQVQSRHATRKIHQYFASNTSQATP